MVIAADSQDHTITISGAGFFDNDLDQRAFTDPISPVQSTTVLVNGVAVTTRVLTNSTLEADIPGSLCEVTGVLNIQVSNPQNPVFDGSGLLGTVGSGVSWSTLQIQVEGGDRVVPGVYASYSIYGPYKSTFGRAVVGCGDVNGDGMNDYVVGLPDIAGGELRCYSSADGALIWRRRHSNLRSLGANVAVIGDWTGDGVPEIAAGAPDSARVWVLDGVSGSGLRMVHGGSPSSKFGASIAACGDVTGDGRIDFLVGAPDHNGRGAVFFYEPQGVSYDVSRRQEIHGSYSGERFGYAVAGGLDVNGGGPDAVIGAPRYGSATHDGRVAIHDLATGAQVVSKVGAQYELLGTSVAMLASPEGGARAWFAAGAPSSYVAGEPGLVRIWKHGIKPGTGIGLVPGVSIFPMMEELYGNEVDAAFGCSLVDAGDLDEDGFRDLMVGAPGDGFFSRGYVTLISGRYFTELHRITGDAREESFGVAVAAISAQDDATPGLLVGSPRADSPLAGFEVGRILHEDLRFPPSRSKPMITEVRWKNTCGVEVTNFDSEARDVSDWKLAVLVNGAVYETPRLGVTLQPGEILVVTEVGNDYAETPAHVRVLDILPSFSVGGFPCSVALVRPDGDVLDEVRIKGGTASAVPEEGLGGRFRGYAWRPNRAFTPLAGVERIWGLDSNSGGDWIYTIRSSFGLENACSGPRGHDPIPAYPVVINEIDVSPDLIELRRLMTGWSSSLIDMRHWSLLCSAQQGQSQALLSPWPDQNMLEQFMVLGEDAAGPAELPANVDYVNVAALGLNIPFHNAELSCALYDHYGRLVDLVRATGHDDTCVHNDPRAPAAWDAFHGAAARSTSGAQAFGRDYYSSDSNSGADWRAVTTRSMGSPNSASSMTGSAGLGDALDVRFHDAGGQGKTLIINAGANAQGLRWSYAVFFLHDASGAVVAKTRVIEFDT